MASSTSQTFGLWAHSPYLVVAKWLLLPSAGLTFAFQAGRKVDLPRGKESVFIRKVQLSWRPHLVDLSLASIKAKSSDPASCKAAGRRGSWVGWPTICMAPIVSYLLKVVYIHLTDTLCTPMSPRQSQPETELCLILGKLVGLLQASLHLPFASQALLLKITLIVVNCLWKTEDILDIILYP